MATKIQGGSSTAGLADVDSNYNLQVNTPANESLAGFVTFITENDAGSVTGERYMGAVEVSHDYRTRVGIDQTLFNELFPGSGLNSTLWTAPAVTMTVTVAGGFANLNAASSIAINAVARVSSYRHFPCYKSYTTYR